MSKIELTQEQFRDLVREEVLDDFEQVESSDWEVDYKWQHCEVIVIQAIANQFQKLYAIPSPNSALIDHKVMSGPTPIRKMSSRTN